MLLIGLMSGGPFAGRVLQGGLVLLALGGLAAIWMWRRGTRLDREHDEREQLIVGCAATFTVLVTAVSVQAYWAWRLAAAGNAGDDVFRLLVLFWGSFADAYVYNRFRT